MEGFHHSIMEMAQTHDDPNTEQRKSLSLSVTRTHYLGEEDTAYHPETHRVALGSRVNCQELQEAVFVVTVKEGAPGSHGKVWAGRN